MYFPLHPGAVNEIIIFIYYECIIIIMSKKHILEEIDNRDSNTTELVLENGDRLVIDFQDSIDILISFIENTVDPDEPPTEAIRMIKKVYDEIDSMTVGNDIDIS